MILIIIIITISIYLLIQFQFIESFSIIHHVIVNQQQHQHQHQHQQQQTRYIKNIQQQQQRVKSETKTTTKIGQGSSPLLSSTALLATTISLSSSAGAAFVIHKNERNDINKKIKHYNYNNNNQKRQYCHFLNMNNYKRLSPSSSSSSLFSSSSSSSSVTAIISDDDDHEKCNNNANDNTNLSAKEEEEQGEVIIGTPTDAATTKVTKFKYAYIAERTRPDFPLLTYHSNNNDDDYDNDSNEIINIQNNNKKNKKHKPLIYFDSAATSQKPQIVLDTYNEYYSKYNSNVHRGAYKISRDSTKLYEESRTTIQNFINAKSRNEIIFTSGATEAINLIASSYGRKFLNNNDEIILTVAEHHSNLIPWQLLANEKNLKLKFITINTTTGLLNFNSELKNLLNPNKTKIISFQHISNVLGYIHPIQTIIQTVREICNNNCIIILDACQSIPHMKINVQKYDIDFLVASSHKMCGPTGIGFLYGKENILNNMDPYKGGGEMIDTVTLYNSTYLLSPARFEAGTPPIAQAIGLKSAIQYLNNIVNMNIIQHYENELGTYMYQQLKLYIPDLIILGPEPSTSTSTSTITTTGISSSSIDHDNNDIDIDINDENNIIHRVGLCTFYHPKVHSSDISTLLDIQSNIAIRSGHHCCQPLHTEYNISHTARASLYFYNTKEEIDYFVQELRKTIEFFTGVTYPKIGSNNNNKSNNNNNNDDIHADDVYYDVDSKESDDDDDDDVFVPFI